MSSNMAFSPYPIYNIQHGKVTNRKPWLLPPDAFEHLENCYIQRGILKKRMGIQAFDRMVHREDDENIGTGDVGGTVTFAATLANIPIREIELVTDDSTSESFTDNGDGTLTGDGGGSGTINYTTGAISVTFNAAPANGDNVIVDYDWYPGHATMGIGSHINGNAASLLVCDLKRVAKYTSGLLEDLGGTDIFTGDDTQFFWFENWLDKVYMTNNNDNIYEYDGTTLQAYAPVIGGGGGDSLDASLLIFVYKGRLVFLNTTEDSDNYYQRARWSDINDPDTLSTANFVDCPTADIIVGADFFGDDLIVFFETSTWRLRYTGNSDLPFKWEKIPGVDGAAATMSLTTFHNRIEALGQTQMVLCDNVRTLAMDQAIPNYVLDFNVTAGAYAFGIVSEETKQTYLSMTDLESEKPDRILVHDYEGNTWALWKMDCHVFGFYDIDSDDAPTWDGLMAYLGLDENTISDDVDFAFNDRATQLGFPLTLMGDRDGFLFKMNTGTNDDGSAIDFEALYGEWNPFIEDGKECDLGHIDFKYRVNGNTTINIDLFINGEPTPWATRTLVLSGNGDTDWGRVEVGCTAQVHQIRVYHNEADQPVEIEATVPWMQPGGDVI